MANVFSTTSTTSWGSGIGKALVGVVLGPLLLIGAAVLIFWNESHSVRVIKSLKEGAAHLQEAEPTEIDREKEGHLIHLTGETATAETLSDPEFSVEAKGIRLNRVVKVYAWTEEESTKTSTSVSGSKTKTKTYTYTQKWVDTLPRSSHFAQKEGHENPTTQKYHSTAFPAEKVTLGEFTLDADLTAKLVDTKAVPLTEETVELPEGAQLAGGLIYVGADPDKPAVGDLRITETIVPNGTVSVIAGQGINGKLGAYNTEAGEQIALVETGTKSAAAMFLTAHSANRVMTWLIRGAGFLLLFLGFLFFLGPISALSSIIPFLGGIVEAGMFVISLLAAVIVWVFLVAAAWMVARPIMGGLLFVLGLGVLFFAIKSIRAGAARRHAQATATQTPPLAA